MLLESDPRSPEHYRFRMAVFMRGKQDALVGKPNPSNLIHDLCPMDYNEGYRGGQMEREKNERLSKKLSYEFKPLQILPTNPSIPATPITPIRPLISPIFPILPTDNKFEGNDFTK
jgi:hypothetical protein